ncbi:MAG: FliM/FliN family flagellar motor switch protein [Pseudomonadota bacterium]
MPAQDQSVIHRMVGGGRVGRAPIADVETIGEDFAKFLDERLRGLMRTITSAIVIDCEVRRLSSVLEEIPVPAMIGVIKVRDSANQALVNVGMDLIYHIVDLRMGGDPSDAPIPTARSVTSVDCGLCEDFISAVCDGFEAALELNLGTSLSGAMTLAQFEQHVTMVRIAPEHSDVLVIRISLDMGEAARSGEFDLVLPLAVLDAYRAAAPLDAGAREGRSDIWSRKMAQAASDAPVRLEAVLHRLRLPVADVEALAVGDLLPLPGECRESVEVRIEGQEDAAPLAFGRLGAVPGAKAVKLTEDPDPRRVAPLRAALTRSGPAS